MKNLILYLGLLLFFVGCSSLRNKGDNIFLQCLVIDIQEYEYAFKFKALNPKNDTILILSLKENYYNKNNYKKSKLGTSEEIKPNQKYIFSVVPKKPTVSNMQQLGAFLIIEKDTIYKASNYKEIPLTFVATNSIGKYYSK